MTVALRALSRRRWLVLAIGLLLLAALPFVWAGWRTYAFRREVIALVAELDRTDPCWRLEEIDADRPAVPDAENSALLLERFFKPILTRSSRIDWSDVEARSKEVERLTPNARLTDAQYWACIDALEVMESALAPVSRLADLPRGRPPVRPGIIRAEEYGVEMAGTREPSHVEKYVFRFLLPVHVHEGDLPAAARDCAVVLNAARSVGDHPSLATQNIRAGLAARAGADVEYVLGHGELSPPALADLQDRFADEATHAYWRIGLRGSRASDFRFLEGLSAGRISMAYIRRMTRTGPPSYGRNWDAARDWFDDHFGADPRPEVVAHIRLMTPLLASADRPPHEIAATLLAEDPVAAEVPLAYLRPMQRSLGGLRAAVAALAVERYRLARGRWPDSLTDLAPSLLPAVPADPFDGGPLRFRRVADGVAIGRVGRGDDQPAFRLWDVPHRNRPPTGDAP